MTDLSPTTELAILLTARWAVNGTKPLTNTEYLDFRRWLGNTPGAASELMSGSRATADCPLDQGRIKSLLARAFGVFQPMDRWMQAGLWVRSWADPDYPTRFKQLRHRAPILLFGYGNPEAFSSRALAIVGSRDASEERLAKTAEIGRACAKAKVTIVSGGARGVDSTAMNSGIAGGGTVVGVLADSLLKASGRKNYRDAILSNRLCLMSEVNPEARFDVGTAMARNRLAYACADAALVIDADAGKGGTWQGAMEARREGKAVYVLRGAKAERQLVDLGAIPIDVDFGLQPDKLIGGVRPDPTENSSERLLDWLCTLSAGAEPDATQVLASFNSDPEAFVLELISIATGQRHAEGTLSIAGSDQARMPVTTRRHLFDGLDEAELGKANLPESALVHH